MINTLTKNLKGEVHPEFVGFIQETGTELREMVSKYAKYCFDNKIDGCAADGFFLNIAAHELAMQRSKILYEEYKRTGNRFDD